MMYRSPGASHFSQSAARAQPSRAVFSTVQPQPPMLSSSRYRTMDASLYPQVFSPKQSWRHQRPQR